MTATAVQAAKVLPKPTVITQSDGTRLTVIGHGDEDFHYYTTADGVILCHKGFDYFVAGIGGDGEIVCTEQLAHEPAERTAEEMEVIRLQDRSRFFASAAERAGQARARRAASVANDNTLFPHTGSPRVLVVLAEFSDVKFTVPYPKEQFGQYLNAGGHGQMKDYGFHDTDNYGSVAQYFKDMSFGSFTPQFDIYGPVTLSQPLRYYGAGNDNMGRFIPDVCKAVDSQVNFKDYDQNNDGNVDLIYVIYAGYSESIEGNSTDCIWPKSGTVGGGTYDGVSVSRYGVNNELNGTEGTDVGLINGIGLFCHEFSHCMGMPDLYVTTAAPEETQHANNQEMEYWSLMDSGCYQYNGYCPVAYTAWEREFLGWHDIETLSGAAAVELKTIDNGGKAYRISNDNDATGNEYYIIENIQKEGWNRYQFGHGMLAVHVDYDAHAFSLSGGGNVVNNTKGHPRMTVLAADGLLLNFFQSESVKQFKAEAAGDPFPGTGEVHELTDDTSVRPVIYTGEKLNKPIYDIQEDTATGIVSFKFLDRNAAGIKDAVTENDYSDNRIYTIDGIFVGTDAGVLKKGIYVVNKKKVVIR